MSITLQINGRAVIPLRAIPYAAGFEPFTRRLILPPSLIINAARNACDGLITPGIPSLPLYRLSKDGPRPVAAEYLDTVAHENEFQPEDDEPLRESSIRLPEGIFCFTDELERYLIWLQPDGVSTERGWLNVNPELPSNLREKLLAGFSESTETSPPPDQPAPYGKEDPLNTFRAMPSLNPDELKIEIAAGESGGVVLNISAREKLHRVSLVEMGLFDKRKAEPNVQYGVLLGLAGGRLIPNSEDKKISNLRRIFKERLGISSDPFLHTPNGYKAIFSIQDKRDAADKRAKENAERTMSSLDELAEQGYQFAAKECDFDSDDDEAGRWLEANDR